MVNLRIHTCCRMIAFLSMVVLEPGILYAQDKSASEPVVVSAVLSPPSLEKPLIGISPPRWPIAIVDLGKLSAQETHRFRVEVLNTTEQPIRFRKFVSGTRGVEVSINGNEFLPGQSFSFSLHYTPNAETTEVRPPLRLSFFGDNDANSALPVAEIVFKPALAGLLSLRQPSMELSVAGDGLARLESEVFMTSPVSFASLEVIKSDELKEVTALVEQKQGKTMLVMEMPGSMLPEEGLRGEIVVADRKTGAKTTLTVRLDRPQKLVLSPHTIRFVPAQNHPEELKALALLRIRPEGDDPASQKLESVSCQIRGVPVRVESKALAAGIYRLDLFLDASSLKRPDSDEAEEAPEQLLSWRLQVGKDGEIVERTTGFIEKSR